MRVGKSAEVVMSMRLDAAARTSALAIRAAGDPAIMIPRFLARLELVAGLAWRTWCETLGRQQTQNWTGIRIKRGLPSGEISEIEMTVARRLHAAAAAIGPGRTRLLCVLLVDDARCRVIAAAAGVADPKTAKTHAAEALSALAAWLDGRRVPDRFRRRRGRLPRKCAGTLA
jgi:hypothetical protein